MYLNSTNEIKDLAMSSGFDGMKNYLDEQLVMRNSGREFSDLISAKKADRASLVDVFGDQNIRNWESGKTIPKREFAIRLCFLLKLSGMEAETFLLKTCGHEWFHLRNYSDIIFFFCIENGLPYETAVGLVERYSENAAMEDDGLNMHIETSFTHKIDAILADKNQSLEFETEEYRKIASLCELLDNNRENIGTYRITASKEFRKYFDDYQKDSHETFERICDEMRMGIPTGLDVEEASPLQISIFNDTPHRQTITYVYNGKPDSKGRIHQVTRKSLLLISLLANEYKREEKSSGKHYDDMLYDCGMPKLDPKNPFDLIVLHALSQNESPVIERIEQLIEEVYKNAPITKRKIYDADFKENAVLQSHVNPYGAKQTAIDLDIKPDLLRKWKKEYEAHGKHAWSKRLRQEE